MTQVQLPPVYRGAEVYDVRATALPYHLADIQMPRHWRNTGGGAGIRVGVADTGIDAEHPEITGRILDGKSFVGRRHGSDFRDGNDHGTHVGTTIAGANVGVAPQAELVIAKVLGSNGSGSNQGVAKGIYYLIDSGCHIINLSLGGPYDDADTRNAILTAIDKGILVFAATGNEGASHVGYPAAHAIGIGAVDRGMKLAYFSNRGKKVDLVGYGVNVYAGVPNGRYQEMSGTSMATPFVAGLAANRLSAELKHLGEIRTRSTAGLLKMETMVTDLGPEGKDTSYGRGFVDVERAFYEQLEATPTEPDEPLEPLVVRVETASGGLYKPVTMHPEHQEGTA